MKIALVSPYDYSYPGGVSTHVAHLEREFLRRGHEVRVIAPSSRTAEELGNPRLLALGRPVPIALGVGGSVARISLHPRLSPRIKQILAEERFDVVHLHEPLVPFVAITTLRFSRSLTVGTFHAYAESHRGYRYLRRLLDRYLSRLDGKIAVSEPARAFISKYFPGDYTVIPNGIDFPLFSSPAAPLPQFQDGKLNILFVGRWERRKGLPDLLEAYRLLKGDFPQSRLIVVGPDGGRRAPYERLVSDYLLRDVHLVGLVPSSELPSYYQAAHIFCAPSTGKESFGLVLLEAMAAGRPIVASDIAGYASVIGHGAEGFLVPPKDPQALAAALARLLADGALREQMGAQGREKAQQYDWPLVAAQVLSFYEQVRQARLLARGA